MSIGLTELMPVCAEGSNLNSLFESPDLEGGLSFLDSGAAAGTGATRSIIAQKINVIRQHPGLRAKTILTTVGRAMTQTLPMMSSYARQANLAERLSRHEINGVVSIKSH